MRLLVQPLDSVAPLIRAIDGAKKSVEIVIFRLDRREVEQALANAVSRGVFVHALIARTNRGGADGLRALEMRLLDSGVTVARTADDLLRYHDKFLIVDRATLILMAFNLTHLDLEKSRSFAIVTRNVRLVQEAVKLFEADAKRHIYVPSLPTFIVSPVNARRQLSRFISEAKKELLIYDPRISDRSMIRLLEERVRAGVELRIIGRVTLRSAALPTARKLAHGRLHTRVIVRDRRTAFIGSQSLRQVELDSRREAGIIVHAPKVISRLIVQFDEDWEEAVDRSPEENQPLTVEKAAHRVAKTLVRDLPPIAPALQQAFRDVMGEASSVDIDLDEHEVEETVKDAMKQIIRDIVNDAVDDVDAESLTPLPNIYRGNGRP